MLIRNLVKVFVIVSGLLGIAALSQRANSATTLLPNGEQCFQTGAGPVVAGSVNMYTVGTTTPKTTWTNSSQSATNTNPIQLDANGCAIIYGVGSYRQQLWSGPVVGGVATGNLIYDLTTADTSSFNSVFWAGTAGGTPNAITVTDAGFNNTDGSVINFIAANSNTGATTLSVSGGSPINIEVPGASGPAALTSGCLIANNPVSVVYSSSAAAFLLLTSCAATAASVASIAAPQGYLCLCGVVSQPIIQADAIGSTTVNYAPIVGNQVPIWNGTQFNIVSFGSSLTVALTSGSNLANTIYDIFVFLNNGTPTLVTGPAWASSAAGNTFRGTGVNTTQLLLLNGIYVNNVQITGKNGASTFTIPAEQATYLGSILVDSTPGQVSNYVSVGQNRKWGVWNAYNRQVIVLTVSDPTQLWAYSVGSFRPSNNSTANSASVFTGLAQEQVVATFYQQVFENSATTPVYIGVAINTTNTVAGIQSGLGTVTANITGTISSNVFQQAMFGLNTFQAVEWGSPLGSLFFGGSAFMTMFIRYHG